MDSKQLLKGNEALAEAAIRAGCRAYFGYPITPQNEVPAYMAKRMPEVGGVFVQAESELAAINMVFGGGATGIPVMTSSSSPGISLMQEGISYIAAAEIPAVLANIVRGGPGLGNISPSQADYFQSVKGGGHGDYRLLVYLPASVQEMADLTVEAFNASFTYRIPSLILGDGVLGQMSEPVILPEMRDLEKDPFPDDWALCKKKSQTIIRSLFLGDSYSLEMHNAHLQEKYLSIEKNYPAQYTTYNAEDADYLIVSYGSTARVAKAAIDLLRNKGYKAGLFRPITAWPFPGSRLKESAEGKKHVFVVEMAQAQFEEDVRLTLEGAYPITGFYKLGGALFNQEELAGDIERAIKGERS